jgi:hypothetical protein
MMRPEIVYEVPTWLSGGLIVLATIALSIVAQAIVHSLMPVRLRNQHTSAVTAIFSVIGITYAVLLAFVAMLTWDGFNAARANTFAEAGAVAEMRRLTVGVAPDEAAKLSDSINGYVHAVVDTEWPSQTRGVIDLSGEPWLLRMHAQLGALQPTTATSSTFVDHLLIQLGNLGAARQGRLAAVEPTVPAVVWVVVLVGGAFMILFSAFLEAPSFGFHLLMTGALGASGALVMVLIVSLNSPFRSDFRIPPTAFAMQATILDPRR